MKKKILSLSLALAMAAIAVVGGTMAYFTDSDEATNTFTAGGVSIELIEKESNEAHTGFVEYTEPEGGKILMPIVGSAQGEKYENGQPKAANYVDKVVTIKNDGKSDAWVRAYFAIPSALDNGPETYNAGLNILHFNFGNEAGKTTYGNQWDWKNEDGKWNCFVADIEGVSYNVYYADYHKPLAADETTEQLISGVYLDKDVDMNKDGVYTITRNGKTEVIEGFDGSAVCPVYAVAVQTAGFDTVDAAVTEAFGADFNPWAE